MKEDKHKIRHQELHEMLDELVADFISETEKSLRETNLMELMEWSYKQTL